MLASSELEPPFFHDHLHLLSSVNYNSMMPILSETRESRETFDFEIMLKYAKSF